MDKIFSKKSFWFTGAALIVVFSISLLVFLFNGNKYERRVLFFPNDMSRVIKGETRYLPEYDSLEKNITLVVKELLLGPEYILYGKAAPAKTKLNKLILNGAELYLDFSVDIALIDSESLLHFDDIIKLIKKTVMFNFKHIRTVNITVDGQIPDTSYYEGRPDK